MEDQIGTVLHWSNQKESNQAKRKDEVIRRNLDKIRISAATPLPSNPSRHSQVSLIQKKKTSKIILKTWIPHHYSITIEKFDFDWLSGSRENIIEIFSSIQHDCQTTYQLFLNKLYTHTLGNTSLKFPFDLPSRSGEDN